MAGEKEMTPWQYTSNRERLSYIYQSGEMSDVTLTVGRDGENKKSFRVHRLILSMQSDVFFTMFYGSLPEKDQVEIIDISPSTFEILMQYVYEDSFLVKSVEEALETYFAAEKYNIPHLRSLCATYITAHVSTENIPVLYRMPNILDALKIKSQCDKMLSEETSHILKSAKFLKSPLALVENILLLDHLSTESEAELFQYVLKWTKSAINVSEPTIELRAEMDRFLPHIRFLAMSVQEFVSGPARSGILTDSEKASILENLVLPGCTQLPSWCNKSTSRSLLRSSRIFQNHNCVFPNATPISFGVTNSDYSFVLKMAKGTLKFRGISFYIAAFGWMEPKASLSVFSNDCYFDMIKFPTSNESTSAYDPKTSQMKLILSKPFIMNSSSTEYRMSIRLQGSSFKDCSTYIGEAVVETESFQFYLYRNYRQNVHLYEIFYS